MKFFQYRGYVTVTRWLQHVRLCFEHFVIYLEMSSVHHLTMHYNSLILMLQENSRGILLHPLLNIF